MDNMLLIRCAFLVLKKAFDVIDHSTRLNKLQYSGFETISSNGFKITFLTESNHTCKLIVLPQTKGLSIYKSWGNTKKQLLTDASPMFLYADDTEVHRSGSDLEVHVNEDLQNFAS